jgi:hypothetical protein
MRKIEKLAIEALAERVQFERDNTRVSEIYGTGPDTEKWGLFLHGNRVATVTYENGELRAVSVDNCGYKTPTTKSRINAVLDGFDIPYTVRSKSGDWHIFGPNSEGYFNDDFTVEVNPNTERWETRERFTVA